MIFIQVSQLTTVLRLELRIHSYHMYQVMCVVVQGLSLPLHEIPVGNDVCELRNTQAFHVRLYPRSHHKNQSYFLTKITSKVNVMETRCLDWFILQSSSFHSCSKLVAA